MAQTCTTHTDFIAKPVSSEDVKTAIKLGYRPLSGSDVWVMPSSKIQEAPVQEVKKPEPAPAVNKASQHYEQRKPIQRTLPSDTRRLNKQAKSASCQPAKPSQPRVSQSANKTHTMDIVVDGVKVCSINF